MRHKLDFTAVLYFCMLWFAVPCFALQCLTQVTMTGSDFYVMWSLSLEMAVQSCEWAGKQKQQQQQQQQQFSEAGQLGRSSKACFRLVSSSSSSSSLHITQPNCCHQQPLSGRQGTLSIPGI
jgi:hypothetical protein